MYYVYVIYNPATDNVYYGRTVNLKRRLKEHKRGNNPSTSQAADWQLVYYEAYRSKKDAIDREGKLKQYGASVGHLKKRITHSIKDIE